MTAGRSLLKSFSWSLKNKKRDRSGSGGSQDLNNKRKSSNNNKQKRLARKSQDEGLEAGMGSSLEIVAPASSDVEFKYSWPINSFVHQVKNSRSEGLDSKPFEVNVNGIHTTWSLSVRFWVGENGERLSNPFVLCLNLVSCKVDGNQEVRVKYRFGIYNRSTEEPEMGAPERVTLKQETIDKLQSVGYKNIAMSDKHVNSAGDVLLFVRLSIIREEEANHSLSSDLKSLINDEKSSDLILEAGERKFLVHKNILAARSPVFADLLARLDPDICQHDHQSFDHTTSNQEPAKLVPIQESNHSNTSKDIRLLDNLDRKCDTIEETEYEETNPATKEDDPIRDLAYRETEDCDVKEDKEHVVTDDESKDADNDEVSETCSKDCSANISKSEEEKIDCCTYVVEDNNSESSLKEELQLARRKDSSDVKRRIVIDDLPGDTVEELLKYIYTDSSHNVESFSQTLLAASDKYKLPGLKQHCEKHLVEILSPINVSDILLLSDNYGCKHLKKAALTYCGDNHSYIMKDSKWKTIEKENPDLFEEAISVVAPDSCNKHSECLKKGGNRYEAEKSVTKGSLGLPTRKKSTITRKL